MQQGCGRRSWVHWPYRGSKLTDRPAPTIADEVARIARQELAPLAGAIDAGSVYPGELLRGLGKVGAWSSHVPQEGPADLRCAIQSIAVIGEICGATAFMAWCQNTLVWYAANSTNLKLARRFGDSFSSGRVLGGTGLSNPMKSFFGIERAETEGPQGRGRLHRQGRAALGLQSRARPLFRHHLRARGRVRPAARRHRDVPGRLLRSGDHPAAVQAVPRHGRHRHLWRAVPRRVRAG